MANEQESNIRFACVGTTDVGRVREHNEDNFLVADLAADKRGASGEVLQGPVRQRGLTLVVADGMGGAAAGEVASQMAVDTLHGEFKNADLGGTVRSEPDVIGLLETAINKANESIFRKGQESKDHQGMGTTLTAAVVLGDSLYLSQVGDSRGYVLRKGKLVQMTRDQSLIGQLIEEGTLTEEQAEKLGGKNIILQALGVEESLKIDSKRYDVLRGDTLLLCSDGLSGMVPDPKIEEILVQTEDPKEAGRKLIEAANEGGGKDNITCIVARFDGEGLREPLSPLTEAERAGGTFRAPPPPKSKAARNAVIGAVSVLAAAAIWLAWPTKVAFPVKASVDATLKIACTSDAAAFPETTVAVKAGVAEKVLLPRNLRFLASVEAPGHVRREFPFDTDTKVEFLPEWNVVMERNPALSLDFEPPPYKQGFLSQVTVKIVPLDGQAVTVPPFQVKDGVDFPEKFPSGRFTFQVSRSGFAPMEKKEVVLEPEKPAKVTLPEMLELFGTLEIKDIPEGATVTGFDDLEVVLDKPPVAVTGTTGPVKVRATEVSIRVVREGYEFQDKRQVVAADGPTEVSFAATKGSVSFAGPSGDTVRLTPAKGGRPILFEIKGEGKSDRKPIDPGEYKAEYLPAEGDRVSAVFKCAPGQLLLDQDVKVIFPQ